MHASWPLKTAAGRGVCVCVGGGWGGGVLQKCSVYFRVFRMVMADGIKDFLWMRLWASGTLYLLPDGKANDTVVFWQTQTHLYTCMF